MIFILSIVLMMDYVPTSIILVAEIIVNALFEKKYMILMAFEIIELINH